MRVATGLRALGLASLGAIAAISSHPSTAAAAAPMTPAQRVVAITEAQLGKPYVFGAAGPATFDCSGLVLYVYERAGLANRVGGGHYALAMYRWFEARGLASTSNPEPGDLVVYGGGAHIAIYIGNGMQISALNSSVGVVERGVHALHLPFTAYLHTHLSGEATASVSSTSALFSTARRTSTRTPHYVAPSHRINFRAAESLTSRVIRTIPAGAHLHVLGTGLLHGIHWYHVSYAGRTGWVVMSVVHAV